MESNLTIKSPWRSEDHDCQVLNPFVDWAFKYFVQQEDILKEFLNRLLEPASPIVSITYGDPEVIPDNDVMKRSVFDVLCRDEKGTEFIVEMQNSHFSNMKERLLYYACRLIDHQGRKGNEWQYNLRPVVGICIMNQTISGLDSLRSDVHLIEEASGKVFSDKIRFVILQAPRLKAKSFEEGQKFCESLIYLLKEMQKGMKTAEQLKAEIMLANHEKALKEYYLKIVELGKHLTPADQEKYDESLKIYRDSLCSFSYAKNEGREEGRAEGREEGFAEGKEVGREEEKAAIARSMKEAGLPVETIARCTGLAEREIITL